MEEDHCLQSYCKVIGYTFHHSSLRSEKMERYRFKIFLQLPREYKHLFAFYEFYSHLRKNVIKNLYSKKMRFLQECIIVEAQETLLSVKTLKSHAHKVGYNTRSSPKKSCLAKLRRRYHLHLPKERHFAKKMSIALEIQNESENVPLGHPFKRSSIATFEDVLRWVVVKSKKQINVHILEAAEEIFVS